MNMHVWAVAIFLLGGSGLADAEGVSRPRMSSEQAHARLQEKRIAPLRSNLTHLIMNGDVESVEAMLTVGIDPNEKDSFPQSVMEFAVTSCAGEHVDDSKVVEMIDVLLAFGASPNEPGMIGTMITAAQQCPPIVVKRLIAAGAKLDVRTPQGYTPLSMALIVSNYDTAEVLIDAGARLSPEAAKKLLEGNKDNARLAALVKRATKK